ncbi:helix-turn-helix transcriptional regulator [Terriglobus saanensis]|uniref:Transcriptional regulator, LuxR family n=1 Tax=Terriglobus saanensis (strain ATCC BAA-1853 / DSM 23119 / SP1PR4) TaxID=401053 RepID=E8UZC0_TERSS|nr:response regulator transcription factor [Terriglobus saanensis]ADV82138.1 transcriptional regulator, LuxR family [Terriglobus saanensis SP1PR4]
MTQSDSIQPDVTPVDATSTDELPTPSAVRIGMVTSEPLRLLGTQDILGETIEVIPLTPTEALRDSAIDLVLVDNPILDDLLAIITSFRRGRPALRVVTLGPVVGMDVIERIIAAGAKGYLTYTSGPGDLRMAIEVVRDGSVWAPRKVLSRLMDLRSPEEKERPELRFTPREKQVLELLAAGHTNRDIAGKLSIDETTAKTHVGRLLRKIGVPNRVGLALYAVEKQIVIPGVSQPDG